MPELSKPGSEMGAETSSARASPSASIRGCGKSGSGATEARIRSTRSETGSSSAIGSQDRRRVDALGARCLDHDVTHDSDAVAEGDITVDDQRRGLAQRRGALGEALVEV